MTIVTDLTMRTRSNADIALNVLVRNNACFDGNFFFFVLFFNINYLFIISKTAINTHTRDECFVFSKISQSELTQRSPVDNH